MTKWKAFRALRAAMSDPDRIGDVGIYKSELAGGRARPEIERALAAMGSTFPRIDSQALEALPAGTLGREYIRFLEVNGLRPFQLSEQIGDDLLARNIFVARYSLLHDAFHVLTGFDTSRAGELGVWSFVAAQGYSRGHWVAVIVACLVYPVLAPLQMARMVRNLRLGISMGRAATTLITVPLESMWDRPVAALRRELNIEPAHELDAGFAAPAGRV